GVPLLADLVEQEAAVELRRLDAGSDGQGRVFTRPATGAFAMIATPTVPISLSSFEIAKPNRHHPVIALQCQVQESLGDVQRNARHVARNTARADDLPRRLVEDREAVPPITRDVGLSVALIDGDADRIAADGYGPEDSEPATVDDRHAVGLRVQHIDDASPLVDPQVGRSASDGDLAQASSCHAVDRENAIVLHAHDEYAAAHGVNGHAARALP